MLDQPEVIKFRWKDNDYLPTAAQNKKKAKAKAKAAKGKGRIPPTPPKMPRPPKGAKEGL